MSSLPSSVKTLAVPQPLTVNSKTRASMYAAILGLLLVAGAGFAQIEEVHNGAHDARHSAGFPCH